MSWKVLDKRDGKQMDTLSDYVGDSRSDEYINLKNTHFQPILFNGLDSKTTHTVLKFPQHIQT